MPDDAHEIWAWPTYPQEGFCVDIFQIEIEKVDVIN